MQEPASWLVSGSGNSLGNFDRAAAVGGCIPWYITQPCQHCLCRRMGCILLPLAPQPCQAPQSAMEPQAPGGRSRPTTCSSSNNRRQPRRQLSCSSTSNALAQPPCLRCSMPRWQRHSRPAAPWGLLASAPSSRWACSTMKPWCTARSAGRCQTMRSPMCFRKSAQVCDAQ